MRKEALFILSRYLWPVDGGRKESLNHYIKELYDKFDENGDGEIDFNEFLEGYKKM